MVPHSSVMADGAPCAVTGLIGKADFSDILSFSRENLRTAFSDHPEAIDLMRINAITRILSGTVVWICEDTINTLDDLWGQHKCFG